jgi:hypothetical protein
MSLNRITKIQDSSIEKKAYPLKWESSEHSTDDIKNLNVIGNVFMGTGILLMVLAFLNTLIEIGAFGLVLIAMGVLLKKIVKIKG